MTPDVTTGVTTALSSDRVSPVFSRVFGTFRGTASIPAGAIPMCHGRTQEISHSNRKRPATSLRALFVFGNRRCDLLNREICEMLIVFGGLRQQTFDLRIGCFEAAGAACDVSLDVANTINFGQSASDRSGASPSRHVRNAQANQLSFRRLRCSYGCVGFRCRSNRGLSRIDRATDRHSEQSRREQCHDAFHRILQVM